jgi:hypothetical protein
MLSLFSASISLKALSRSAILGLRRRVLPREAHKLQGGSRLDLLRSKSSGSKLMSFDPCPRV